MRINWTIGRIKDPIEIARCFAKYPIDLNLSFAPRWEIFPEHEFTQLEQRQYFDEDIQPNKQKQTVTVRLHHT